MLIQINTHILVIEFDLIRIQNFHYLTVAWVKNVIIFGVDMSSSVYIDNKGKDILILGIDPAQGLDDITLTAEAQYSIKFSRSNRKICLSLYYNSNNSFLLVHATKIYQFKAKDSEMKKYPLCLRNISGDFSANNIKKQY